MPGTRKKNNIDPNWNFSDSEESCFMQEAPASKLRKVNVSQTHYCTRSRSRCSNINQSKSSTPHHSSQNRTVKFDKVITIIGESNIIFNFDNQISHVDKDTIFRHIIVHNPELASKHPIRAHMVPNSVCMNVDNNVSMDQEFSEHRQTSLECRKIKRALRDILEQCSQSSSCFIQCLGERLARIDYEFLHLNSEISSDSDENDFDIAEHFQVDEKSNVFNEYKDIAMEKTKVPAFGISENVRDCNTLEGAVVVEEDGIFEVYCDSVEKL